MDIKDEPEVRDDTFEEEMKTEEEDNDPVVKEMDVYLARGLANKIFVLQYPIRPTNRTYESENFLGARIMPKQSRLELEVEMDTKNDNYSRVKGEQFALNVDGKQSMINKPGLGGNNNQQSTTEPAKYFRSNLMDKQKLVSMNATLGQMNKLYHLALVKDNSVHLTPVQSVLQMKPSFEYFDICERKVKELKESTQSAEMTDYSTEEEVDTTETDKTELVTLKYSAPGAQGAKETPDESWTQLSYINSNDSRSHNLKNFLLCHNTQEQVGLQVTTEQLMNI